MTCSRLFTAAAVFLLLTVQGVAQTQAPNVRASSDAAAAARSSTPTGDVARGRYLAERVAMCVECHSDRDAQGNIIPAERYMGGPVPPGPAWASNWAIRAPRNKGLPGYTDDQAMRLLTQGAINREGRQLQLPMPRYRMSPQDAADVIAFLRSLP